MTTISSQALKQLVDREMRNPEYAKTMSGYLKNIVRKKYDQLLVDSIFQKNWRAGDTNIYDAHAFAAVHAQTLNGEILSCSIPATSTPHADRAAKENRAILAQLPDFRAVFDPDRGAGANDDGAISWDFELGLYTTVLRNGTHENWKYWIGPNRAPLEVGTTDAARTLLHLREEGLVCRWPYRSKRLLLLVNAERAAILEKRLISTVPCSCKMEE